MRLNFPDFKHDCKQEAYLDLLFKILLFQVALLMIFSIAVLSPYFLVFGLLLQYVALFQSGN